MRKIQKMMISILLLFAMAGTARASGPIPGSYNQDARNLLAMLWDKLDQAIVSNYNVSILLRYHDHAGSDPGDFVTRGKPIGSGGISNGAITATKLSTAVGTKVIAAQLGNLPALGNGNSDEMAVFVAPSGGVINRITASTSNDVAESGVNYSAIGVYRWRGGVINGTPVFWIQSNGYHFTPFLPAGTITSGVAPATFQQNDVYTLYKLDTGTGMAMNDFLVTLEYTVSG